MIEFNIYIIIQNFRKFNTFADKKYTKTAILQKKSPDVTPEIHLYASIEVCRNTAQGVSGVVRYLWYLSPLMMQKPL